LDDNAIPADLFNC